MTELLSAENLIALLTLTSLEIVLGIDNIVFLAILTGRLPAERQASARFLGLALAMVSRVALLFAITWVMRLDSTLFTLFERDFSGKSLILLGGGLFLLGKATFEIHDNIEGKPHEKKQRVALSFGAVMVQITLLDLVFSLDSVITAVGMAKARWVMVTAVVAAVAVMLMFSGRITAFITRHPTMKMLALSFLLLVGVFLIAEGLGQHIEKGYIYFAMAFSLFVEFLNMRARRSLHGGE